MSTFLIATFSPHPCNLKVWFGHDEGSPYTYSDSVKSSEPVHTTKMEVYSFKAEQINQPTLKVLSL